MADSESDSSSVDGHGPGMRPPSPVTQDKLQKRIDSLQQQNRVLKVEIETYKLRIKGLQEENHKLRQASVNIQAKAEQEEEFISNTLLKKIQSLKREKETLAHHYEQEEECLTNDLSRKLIQLRQEKCKLEQTLEQEQECLVNKLMRKIEKLEAETAVKQSNLEQLRREKIELENTLEQEQEALVNKLWKRMDKLETEKRVLQIKLDQPVSDPASPRDIHNGDTASNLSAHIKTLRGEVNRLRAKLLSIQLEQQEKMNKCASEEKQIREENLRLQRKLQLEVERREALCRQLSESETSLEMEEERHFNESASGGGSSCGSMSGVSGLRPRGRSSPIPYARSPSGSRPLSPGVPSSSGVVRGGPTVGVAALAGPARCCHACGQSMPAEPQSMLFLPRSVSPPSLPRGTSNRNSREFAKPINPRPINDAIFTAEDVSSPMDVTKS